jgi:hypothetical protein
LQSECSDVFLAYPNIEFNPPGFIKPSIITIKPKANVYIP